MFSKDCWVRLVSLLLFATLAIIIVSKERYTYQGWFEHGWRDQLWSLCKHMKCDKKSFSISFNDVKKPDQVNESNFNTDNWWSLPALLFGLAKIVVETRTVSYNKCGTFPIAPRSGGSTQFLEYLEYFHLISFKKCKQGCFSAKLISRKAKLLLAKKLRIWASTESS